MGFFRLTRHDGELRPKILVRINNSIDKSNSWYESKIYYRVRQFVIELYKTRLTKHLLFAGFGIFLWIMALEPVATWLYDAILFIDNSCTFGKNQNVEYCSPIVRNIFLTFSAGIALLIGLIVTYQRTSIATQNNNCNEKKYLQEKFNNAIKNLNSDNIVNRIIGCGILQSVYFEFKYKTLQGRIEELIDLVNLDHQCTAALEYFIEYPPLIDSTENFEDSNSMVYINKPLRKDIERALKTLMGIASDKNNGSTIHLPLYILRNNYQYAGDSKFSAFSRRGNEIQSTSNDNLFTDSSGRRYEGSNLQIANFQKARLNKSRFSCKNLQNANFKYSSLLDADFTKSDLRGANFENSNLYNAVFSYANLSDVNFKNAFINKANFEKANYLTKEQIMQADWKQCTERGVDYPILPNHLMEDEDIKQLYNGSTNSQD